jgi:hypothetical protein
MSAEPWCVKYRNMMWRDADGWPMWPVDEMLSRRPVTPSVAARLHRLNPNGVREGDFPRGWHRKRTAKMMGLLYNFVGVRGIPRDVLASLPQDAFFRDGKRRYVERM